MTTDDVMARTEQQDNPTRGRWWLVAAALLLQFSIGAVYAWSVFSKALTVAEPFQLRILGRFAWPPWRRENGGAAVRDADPTVMPMSS
jgi:hypothetical protein